MKITFREAYLSIHSFPPVELPDFTLITGPNGAGKTHFLQALFNSNLVTDAIPGQSAANFQQIRYFDWNTLVPNDTGSFSSETLKNERSNALTEFSQFRRNPNVLNPLRDRIREFGLGDEYLSNPISLASLSDEQLAALKPELDDIGLKPLKDAVAHAENFILGNISPPTRMVLEGAAKMFGKRVPCLEDDDVLSSKLRQWGDVNVFQQSFARLFVSYRDQYLANLLAEVQRSKGYPDAQPLSEDEFVAQNGPPPWDFVNDALKSANLDFRINAPILHEFVPYQPNLRKVTNGVEIPFAHLSSGEKILMSFAFCIYYAGDQRQLAKGPLVLLLDEVDATLHPSMSKNLIDTIQKTLVQHMGIKVIATTHSPSTVALAPEECLYVMKPGVPGLHKTTKGEALDVLTVGVPTLAISFDGRRQVFVESPQDAAIYDALYRILKPSLNTERSLEFVATGTKSPQGDINTGCAVVQRLVGELAAAGNISVLGLVDWDGNRLPTSRIEVLANGTRDGLENVVLDPLAIALMILREFPEQKKGVGFSDRDTYMSVSGLDPTLCHSVASAVVETVVGGEGKQLANYKYCGGLELTLDRRYFLMDDHLLEGKLLEKFPFLHGVGKGQAGRLLERMVTLIYQEHPAIIPYEVRSAFENLTHKTIS